jgi:hypothetical protein
MSRDKVTRLQVTRLQVTRLQVTRLQVAKLQGGEKRLQGSARGRNAAIGLSIFPHRAVPFLVVSNAFQTAKYKIH